MPGELVDAVALVTGAGGGIGQAAALELAARGADVAIHYHRNQSGAAETARRVEAQGRQAALFKGDLARREEAVALVSAVRERLRRIDVLVNNTGDLVERRQRRDPRMPNRSGCAKSKRTRFCSSAIRP